ncbi:MAG: nitrate- and nitrite sensing domain-containing protein [Roseibium sp.]|nr:nitrate- and nitrite sensing domain-containing protein [Roseibium sp.]
MLKSLRIQIALAVIVPLIALLGFTAFFLTESYRDAQRAADLLPISKIAQDAEATLHELQKERGRTAVLLASGHADRPRSLLLEQRELSDAALANLYQAVASLSLMDTPLQTYIQEAAGELDAIAGHRARVDSKLATGAENLKFYTERVRLLLGVVYAAVQASHDKEYVIQMVPFAHLTEATEAGGLERALGGRLFAKAMLDGSVSQNLFLAYYDRLSVETSYLRKFKEEATPEQLAAFDAAVAGPDVDQVMAWRQVLRELPQTLDGQGIDGSVWFATATKRLGLIRSVAHSFVDAAQIRAGLLEANAWNRVYTLAGAALVLVAATLIVSFWQTAAINRSLNTIRRNLIRIVDRELDFEMPMTDRSDVIGELARAGVVFQENARMRLALEADAAQERDKERLRQNQMETLINKFRELMGEVTFDVDTKTENMIEIAERVSAISANASSGAETARNASSSSSENVQTVAAAAEEMASAIDEIMNQSNRANEIISQATGIARQTDQNVSSLSDAAQKIGTVVEMIRDIAEQTNLLALNATIEAARAGEAGKGFAVVAAEVKELSTQTAKATEEIATQISAVQGLTDGAVGSIREITSSIEDIMDVTGAITTAVREQSQATREISQSITMAADGTGNAVQSATAVSSRIQETASEAETVDRIAREVKGVADSMARGVEGFLEEMASDVEERRRAVRESGGGEKITIHTNNTAHTTYLINVSNGGAGVMPFAGAPVGTHVIMERANGSKWPMTIIWANEYGVGLESRAEMEAGGGREAA